MLSFLLAAAMFLPHQSVKSFPVPHDCLSQWGADSNNLQNLCPSTITVDVSFKNGQGRHFDLEPFESRDIGNPDVPYLAAACYKGQGSPSEAPDRMVRPGYKNRNQGYACIEVTLVFNPYAGGR